MYIHHITRKTILAALAIMAVPAAAIAAPAVVGSSSAPQTVAVAGSTATSCPRGWGSLPEANSRMVQSPITNVRTGRHACFDRLVVDLRGRAPGYDVRYVTNVTQDGSGFTVPLRGGAKLQIIVRAPAHTSAGQPTYQPANKRELTNVSGYSTFRQVAYAGSFEGQTTIGLGVRARLPFRVFTLAGPGSNSRLVIDVAHHW
ncbi:MULTISPECIES: AMIN-like domain-containing (lipo)protein [unclassified Kribbella]|uniref:AMIN-like domain-containing (lipo)protein n=1 Tax=unclassified Kribbella TaxID=2644121 RepID=UPI003016CBA1